MIASLWNRLSQLGIDPNLPVHVRTTYALTNRMTLFVLATVLCLHLQIHLMQDYTRLPTNVGALVASLVVLVLHRFGQFVIGRNLVILCAWLALLVSQRPGASVAEGFRVIQVVALCMPLIMFHKEERTNRTILLGLGLLLVVFGRAFMVALSTDQTLVGALLSEMPSPVVRLIASIALLASFALLVRRSESLLDESTTQAIAIRKANEELATSSGQLQERIAESEAQRAQMALTLSQLEGAQAQAQAQAEQLALNEAQLRDALADLTRKRDMDQRLERYSRLLRWHPGQTLQQWGAALLQELARDFRGAQAALYTVSDADPTRPSLQFVAGYATTRDVATSIPFGQGLAGQVVKSGRAYYFDRSELLRATTPAGMLTLKPKADFLLPLMYNDQVQGLLELCTLTRLDDAERQFLQTIGDQIGMALSSIGSQHRIETLLVDAQGKARTLQAQELEMRQTIQQLEVTQQQMREFQNQLEVANNSLEERVADRTRALEVAMTELQSAQNQVVLSEKMAALGQLVAGVAHEMNSPLGAIKASAVNMSDLLPSALRLIPELNTVLSDRDRELLGRLIEVILAPREHLSSKEERKLRRQFAQELNDAGLQEDTDDMARRIVDAGFYGQLDPYLPLFNSGHGTAIADLLYSLGQLKLNLDNISLAADKTKKVVFALKSYAHTSDKHELTSTNLKDHIETVLVIYNNQLKYGIEVESSYPDDLPMVMTYSDELSQVWTNIIQNAIQAMNGVGSLKIEVSHDSEYVDVRIIDSGPGIPADKLEKIFEPFFTTKSRGEGTGLGLDIVRKIVRKHNGDIRVESVPGRTCFIVRLPVDGQLHTEAAAQPAEAVAA